MGTIRDPKSGQQFVVPDDVVVDYVSERPVEVDLESPTKSFAKETANQHGRNKVE